MICSREEDAAEGLARYPDDLPLPARPEEVAPGFFLSRWQVETICGRLPRLSAYEERKFDEQERRMDAAEKAQRQEQIRARREAKKARKLALWRRDMELRELKARRPDWFRPGMNAHNLEKHRQRVDLLKRVAGYFAELLGPGLDPDGDAGRELYTQAVKAVYGVAEPLKSPRKARALRQEVTALAREYVEARALAAREAAEADQKALEEGETPPSPHTRQPGRRREKSPQRTTAKRRSEWAGYSDRPQAPKPCVSGPRHEAGALRTVIGAPACPEAPEGVRNIVWLKARHIPHGVRGLAAANLHRLESAHGRHGCKIEFSRGHAWNWLASALAAGRPLRALLSAYGEAVRAEEGRCRGYNLPSWSPGRVIARARRAAYRMGIVTRHALDEYAQRRAKAREYRGRERAFLARVEAEEAAKAAVRPVAVAPLVIPFATDLRGVFAASYNEALSAGDFEDARRIQSKAEAAGITL